jgi:hypothetical protein
MTRFVAGLTLIVLVSAAVAQKAGEGKPAAGSYVHVVLFTMKKDAPKGAIEEVIKDTHKLLAKIKSVRSVKVGRPAAKASPEFVRRNYDVALLVLVDDHKGLMAYLDDPLHVEFVCRHKKHFDTEQLRVFDFANQTK